MRSLLRSGWWCSLLMVGLVGSCGGDGGSTGPGSGAAGSGGSAGNSPDAGGEAGGATVAPSELTIVSRTPAVGADNVSFYDPIVITFSGALQPASVTAAAISVKAGTAELSKTVTLSADGTTVTVQLDTPPLLAATLSIDVTSQILDTTGAPFVGAQWTWTVPLWQVPGKSVTSSGTLPAVALDAQDHLFVATVAAESAPNPLSVVSWDGTQWQAFGGALNEANANAATAPSLAVSASGTPFVAWAETNSAGAGSVYVKSWDGSSWSLLGGASVGGSGQAPALALDAQGAPVVAFVSGTALVIQHWNGSAWQPVGAPLAQPAFNGIALALVNDAPVVAYYDGNSDVVVQRLSASSWSPVGSLIDRALTLATGRPALAAAADGTLYLGYLDGDAVSSNGYVRHLAPSDSDWVAAGNAVDLVLDADVEALDVRLGANNQPFVAWSEAYAGVTKVYAASVLSQGYRFLGPALSASSAPLVPSVAVAVDSRGNPSVAYQEQSRVALARYNGSPDTPYGLKGRASIGSCAIPDDTSPSFPKTLTATGCYADVAKHVVIAGAVPFEINSALWSDGASKHRFIVLPTGATIGYTATGAWLMPVGTILMKEFLYRAELSDPNSLYPMETRFLVKRCQEGDCAEPFQGYSYQWNDAGTEATLLESTDSLTGLGVTKDWPYESGGVVQPPHTHTYPAREQCVRCHNTSIGRVLGIQTPQLNRARDYGDTIDNQLRAFDHIGLFGSTFPKMSAESLNRVPSPLDPGFSLEQRARGYFHSNCSHCHNPQGACPTIDFRFYGAGLTGGNICNLLTAGAADQSTIYNYDMTRVADPTMRDPMTMFFQMPPLATLIPDARQLPITAAWINSLATCP